MAETEAEEALREAMGPDLGRDLVEQVMTRGVEHTRATLRSPSLSPLSGSRFEGDSIRELKGLSLTSTN